MAFGLSFAGLLVKGIFEAADVSGLEFTPCVLPLARPNQFKVGLASLAVLLRMAEKLPLIGVELANSASVGNLAPHVIALPCNETGLDVELNTQFVEGRAQLAEAEPHLHVGDTSVASVEVRDRELMRKEERL